MKTLFLVSLLAISFILVAQKIYPKIYINRSFTDIGPNGKWQTLDYYCVLNQQAFRINLTYQLTGKYHADHSEMLSKSKMQTITIVDNRRMNMNFNSSKEFLRWINRHGYETQYSEKSGSNTNYTFRKII